MEATCYCSRRVVTRTSWTDLNPGRRYSTCDNYKKIRGCNYFVWIDPPMCDRSRQIIPGLLRKINMREEELMKKSSREKCLWIAVIISWLFVYLLMQYVYCKNKHK
ncbi:hypothetical protein ABFS83_12G053600 [Erythranthe nasuta]